MIVSMTGYGQGVGSGEGTTVTVEVRTVNHRFLDFSIKLPRALQSRERNIKERVKNMLARGRVYVTVSVDSEVPNYNVRINSNVIASYLEQLRKFADEHGIDNEVSLRDLVVLPDVVTTREDDEDADLLWALTETALDEALQKCRDMRVDEGQALGADLTARIQNVKTLVAEIEKVAPEVSSKHAEAFRKRIEQLMGSVQFDSDRLASEIALLADRLDFTEEITRLHSHEVQFCNALDEGGEISKKLTYLLQEMHREASTIGAKASDSEVIRHVVALKEETEKIREQVQNIE